MRVDVSMPQMGESIAEGTITRWIKKVGESVERDEPLFEISTDKVDAEIPSPDSGVLVEIRGREGETVPVNQIVAVIETDASAAASMPAPAASAEQPEAASPRAPRAEPVPAPAPPPAPVTAPAGRTFVSPVVKRIAAERGIDPALVPGTGAGGRVTKKDILAYIERGAASFPASPAPPVGAPASRPVAAEAAPRFVPGDRVAREPMSVMRKRIAEHMVESRRTSAHVHSVFEVDLTRVVELRGKHNPQYLERQGAKISFMAFFIKAVCDALRAWPIVNASVEGDEIVYHKDLNIGVAVALEWGLIVPVIRNADELSIAGLSRRVQDLAQRARAKQLNPDEVQGGTFTITNPGQFGGLYGLPIINQPQVAILGVGGIEKRPVVIDDAIAIRSMMYMALSYDHRVVDGAVADQFLAGVKGTLERFDEALL
jgi:2-oxoglutarate dehydrogenase E2 component (dihydrolipoamide succinyltransferase)